ncbi:unnamed protein product [Cunninghamella blakesleeana]
MKKNLKSQLFLILLFILGFFGVGYQSIPVFTWIFYPVAIYYTRQSWLNLLFFYIINLFANSLAYLGTFSLGNEGFEDVGLVIGFAAAINILIVICFIIDHFAYSTNNTLLRIYTFPFIWTGLWHIFTWYSPFGDFITYSQSMMLWNSFRQIASFGGRAMLDFFMSWFGTVIIETFVENYKNNSHNINKSNNNDIMNQGYEIESFEHSITKRNYLKLKKLVTPFSIFGALFCVMIGYGGGQTSIIKGSFYQRSYPQYISHNYIRSGCVIGMSDGSGYTPSDRKYWFDQTVSLANSGAKLVVWSEETFQTFNSTDQESFLNQASEISKNNSIYLAVSYINNLENTMENLMTFFSPNGTLLLRYNKAHPVPGVEDQLPGPNQLQYVDTPDLGRVGLGICFDYNFPSFMNQAGENQVDIMIQGSWTWAGIGTYHSRSNSIRAIENGFTMLRCGSNGMSGVFTPTSDSPYQQQFPTTTNQTVMFQLPLLKHTRTTYTVFKGCFGWLALAIGLLLFIYAIFIKVKARYNK